MIDWKRIPKAGPGWPFDDQLVLLAVPHRVGAAWGGGLDRGEPFSIHIARWEYEKGRWVTNESDDEAGGVLWLDQNAPSYWAAINPPGSRS
ncbi:hypothetical protein NOVOSPHI9U_310012 [Novosphingobium sp. 9U]|nr:hypothetical protein NOVOSPHI9U_310012 [Novosphingobium sp. 9U]